MLRHVTNIVKHAQLLIRTCFIIYGSRKLGKVK